MKDRIWQKLQTANISYPPISDILTAGKSKGGANAMTKPFRTATVIALKIDDHVGTIDTVLNPLQKRRSHCRKALAPGHLCASQHARPAGSSSGLIFAYYRVTGERSKCVCVDLYHAWELICAWSSLWKSARSSS